MAVSKRIPHNAHSIASFFVEVAKSSGCGSSCCLSLICTQNTGFGNCSQTLQSIGTTSSAMTNHTGSHLHHRQSVPVLLRILQSKLTVDRASRLQEASKLISWWSDSAQRFAVKQDMWRKTNTKQCNSNSRATQTNQTDATRRKKSQ